METLTGHVPKLLNRVSLSLGDSIVWKQIGGVVTFAGAEVSLSLGDSIVWKHLDREFLISLLQRLPLAGRLDRMETGNAARQGISQSLSPSCWGTRSYGNLANSSIIGGADVFL